MDGNVVNHLPFAIVVIFVAVVTRGRAPVIILPLKTFLLSKEESLFTQLTFPQQRRRRENEKAEKRDKKKKDKWRPKAGLNLFSSLLLPSPIFFRSAAR